MSLSATSAMSHGVVLPRDVEATRVREFARHAERVGFDELWVVEDLGYRGGVAQAAAVLAATEHIRVGIGILPAAARNVAFEAMEIATLASLFPHGWISGSATACRGGFGRSGPGPSDRWATWKRTCGPSGAC